jgi:TonB-linked SusC/RagA family outer membrane protein
MRKLTFLLACLFLVGVGLVNAQSKSISGKVFFVDDGQPVIGATVKVKGTTVGTITGTSGEFKISLQGNAKDLVVSYVGMKTIEVEAKNNLVVRMEADSRQIGEVVVTALGISREKKSLGYSVQEVKGSELTKGGNPDLSTSLQGKVAGLEVRQSSGMPGAPSSILIRGARSFSGDNSPLYVIDGMPISSSNDYTQGNGDGVSGSAYSDRSADIDPSNIESINVLKGQAASALYGMRASNGVIIITTKNGKNGIKGKPIVSISNNTSVEQISRLPEVQQLYAQGTGSAWSTASSFSWGPLISNLPKTAVYGGDANGHPGMWFNPQMNKWVEPKAYNNPKAFYGNGVTANTNLNVSQAFENGNYSIGLGATNQTGIVLSTGMDRYSAKFSGEFKASNQVSLGFSSNYSDGKINKLPSGNDSYLFTVYGSPANYDLMGTPYHAPSGPLSDYRQISYRRGAVGENPLWAIHNNKYIEDTKRFFGNAFVEYKPVEYLKARYQIGVDTYSTNNEDYIEMGSSHTGQVLPTKTQYPTPANPNYAYIEPTGGSIKLYGLTRRTINSLLTVSFQKKISDDINLSVLVGNEINDDNMSSYNMLGTGFTVPGWDNLANTSTQTNSNSVSSDRTVGTFGNIALDYKNLLFFNATGREDVVSSMPRGSRSFFYPSASLGFLFTELDALKNNGALSFGKVRASYAEVGMAGTFHPITYLQSGATSGFLTDGLQFPLGGITGYEPNSTLYDPNLKPMNTKSYEAGVELKFFDNRLGLDYTFTNQVSDNQIFPVPLAGSTGYAEMYMNAGEMKSVAHEIVLTAIPVKTKDFEWAMQVNFSKVVSTCVSLAPGVESINLGGYEEPNIRASAGDTYPSIYGNQFAKDDKGRILVDEDKTSPTYGMPYQGKFGKLADVAPDFTMGFNNTFRYKFISFSALLDWKQGGHMYSGSNRLMDLYGSSKRTEDRTSTFVIDGYKADGSKNDIVRGGTADPNAYYNLYANVYANISESNIYETSFLKLRNITLGFDLPKSIAKQLFLQSATLTFSARNILLWTTLPNFDPESSQGQGNMQGGMDYMSLPQTKSFGVGLNLVF